MLREHTPAEFVPAFPLDVTGAPARSKVGLALAGGGFRASLFHLGVLWRMAEVDLLRYVEVLSTVSGGSIIGALYMLLLKRELDVRGTLSRDEYVVLVQELCQVLVRGIQQNLRTRLFWSPLPLLRMMLTPYGMAQHMGRLYDRHLYRQILPGPGPLRLRDLLVVPAGTKIPDLEAFNASGPRKLNATEPHSRVPRLILNATTLNSGAPFQFTSVELGDPRLGFFRHDEVQTELFPRKYLLERVEDSQLRSATTGATTLTYDGKALSATMIGSIVAWLAARKSGSWKADALAVCEAGLLRRAKLSAWYHQHGYPLGITGGKSKEQHATDFAAAICAIDNTLIPDTVLMDRVLEVYYLRSAEAVSWKAAKAMEQLTLAEAVAASACFPPVFPPLRFKDFYDTKIVELLGFTDGGVYDNLGITTLLQEGCTHIVASDTGGVFNPREPSTSGRIGMVARISTILMNAVAEYQRSGLRERHRVTDDLQGVTCDKPLTDLRARYQVQGLAYFHINSPLLTQPRSVESAFLSGLRTDLDAFGDLEAAALINHGYETAADYLAQFVTSRWPPTFAAPVSRPVPVILGPRELQMLWVGRYHFFRALRLGALPTVLAAVLAIALLSTDAAFSWPVLRHAVWWLDRSVFFVVRCVRREGAATWIRLGEIGRAAIVADTLLLGGLLLMRATHRDREAGQRSLVMRWLRTWGGNALWLFGLAPLWMAGVASLSASISYWFNGRPFLAKTALKQRPW